jgi:pre-mRNA-splicing factor RBM22/SLT11
MSVRSDPRAVADEASEFPILCETCLGPNPFVRMLKDKWGRPCKVCERPFPTFRWNPAGPGMRHKNTEICQTCARVKNVCQTCLLDLTYGLPVQVRDAGMAAPDRQAVVAPTSDTMRQYAAAQSERSIAAGKVDAVYESPLPNPLAEKNKRGEPRYERNRAQLCSWFAKGKCARGLYCPYRHELPNEKDHPFAKQNLRDRYYGVNDPVAASILARSARDRRPQRGQKSSRPPPPPEDPSVMSIFVGGLTPSVTEQVLLALFTDHAQHVQSVRIVPQKSIAFVDFSTREAAESAMDEYHGQMELADAKITVSWAKGSSTPGNRLRKGGPPQGHTPGIYANQIPDISGMVPNVQPPPASRSIRELPPVANSDRPDQEPPSKRSRKADGGPVGNNHARQPDDEKVTRETGRDSTA